eukprot:scaffold4777_cov120-Skeletonema_dohrnii-CCMP3373.AAC.2
MKPNTEALYLDAYEGLLKLKQEDTTFTISVTKMQRERCAACRLHKGFLHRGGRSKPQAAIKHA